MRTLLLLLFLLCFSPAVWAQDSTRPAIENWDAFMEAQTDKLTGQPFPAFRARATDGSMLADTDLRGKAVFVNFWFTNCAPCMAEMKGLVRLQDSLKHRPDFLFLSITFDDESLAKATMAKYGVNYKVYRMDKEETKRLNFGNGYPTTFILDRNRIIRFVAIGGVVEKEDATATVLQEFYPKILEQLRQ